MSSGPPLPTQETVESATSFSELVAWVFMSVYSHGGKDPVTGREIDYSNMPWFGHKELHNYSSGDNVVSWDNDWVLYFERRGEPKVVLRRDWGKRAN